MERKSLAEQLCEVESAISAIQSGAQEYSIGNRRVKKADLGTLYQERDRLNKQIATENGYTGFSVAEFYSR